MDCFAQQSTVADTLNSFTGVNVQQLRAATSSIYVREGQAMRHDYEREEFLILDIDVTGLPASQHAEESTKGYFSGKKGGTGGNWHA